MASAGTAGRHAGGRHSVVGRVGGDQGLGPLQLQVQVSRLVSRRSYTRTPHPKNGLQNYDF